MRSHTAALYILLTLSGTAVNCGGGGGVEEAEEAPSARGASGELAGARSMTLSSAPSG
jgi:hypothetical protein